MNRALTIEQVAEAFELVDKGVYRDNIAEIFGVSVTTLNRYLRNAKRYGYSFWETERSEVSIDEVIEQNKKLRLRCAFLESHIETIATGCLDILSSTKLDEEIIVG
jgi:predicted transcriptional regulator